MIVCPSKMMIYPKKKNTQTKIPKRVVGAYVPTYLAEFLGLYAIANEVGIAAILETLLERWKGEVEQDGINLSLLQSIVKDKTVQTFTDSGMPLALFSKKMEGELKRKGLPANYISLLKAEIKCNVPKKQA